LDLRIIDKLKPEIREQVIAVLDAHKSLDVDLTGKSIEDIVSYVRCPHCWSRVYRTMISKIADTKPEAAVAPSDDTRQPADDKGNEKHETNLSLAAKLSQFI
jgi:hypothetical protein